MLEIVFGFQVLVVEPFLINPTKESGDEVYQTGTFIHIQEAMPIKDSLRLLVQGVRRISFDGENIERNQALRTDQNGITLQI